MSRPSARNQQKLGSKQSLHSPEPGAVSQKTKLHVFWTTAAQLPTGTRVGSTTLLDWLSDLYISIFWVPEILSPKLNPLEREVDHSLLSSTDVRVYAYH
jgi:hypothetical protein